MIHTSSCYEIVLWCDVISLQSPYSQPIYCTHNQPCFYHLPLMACRSVLNHLLLYLLTFSFLYSNALLSETVTVKHETLYKQYNDALVCLRFTNLYMLTVTYSGFVNICSVLGWHLSGDIPVTCKYDHVRKMLHTLGWWDRTERNDCKPTQRWIFESDRASCHFLSWFFTLHINTSLQD